jgi:hypothetical protein
MNILNNLYAASYKSYEAFNESARLKSIILLGIIISGLSFMILIALQKLFDMSARSFFKTTPLAIFGIAVLALLVRYYSAGRSQEIIEKYETKSMRERRCWGILTIFLVVAPFTVIAIMLTKHGIY